jgi:hypothetical protein
MYMQEKVKGADDSAEAPLSVATSSTAALGSPPKPATSPQPTAAVAKDEDFDAYIKGLLSNNLADTKQDEKEADQSQGIDLHCSCRIDIAMIFDLGACLL